MTDLDYEDAPLLFVGLGEALFDRFGEAVVLGGAPVNFAVHAGQLLAACGGRATVASRIGSDDLGSRLKRELTERGIDPAGVQTDPSAPTGVVEVTLDGAGQPTYDIRPGAAWDNLQFTDELAALARQCHAVCFGTLAQRGTTSRDAIHKFLAAAPQALRLCDVNLRPPHVDAEVVAASLHAANAVKLNEEELNYLAADFNVESALRMQAVMNKYDLGIGILTRGAQGTTIYRGEEACWAAPPALTPQPGADAVGAGDACAAAAACGLVLQWPLQDIVSVANEAGAFVATRRGATPTLPAEICERLAP